MLASVQRYLTPRAALLATLALIWANFLLTARWAHVPGSINGAKRPWFVAMLVIATLVALRPARDEGEARIGRLGSVLGLGACAWLLACFFLWFPPATWTQIPLLDNWPARYQSTLDGIALLKRGAVVGWQWDFLGGYHTSSDLTVTLTMVAWPWIAAFGPALGFHLVHLVLFLAVPALVYADMRLAGERGGVAPLGAAVACLTSANFSYFLLRSGDTNSLAGVVAAGLAFVGSHACARGIRGGGLLLTGALGLVTYCHAGFFGYTVLFLLMEALCYRDPARLRRAIVAGAAGFVIGLPLTWESWRYPDYFFFNNVLYDPHPAWPVGEVLRKLYYNVEIMFLPNRWFNDFSGLVQVALPIVAFVAWRERGRARFYAWGILLTLLLLRLNIPQLGYAFLRPIHLLAFLAGPVLAVFIIRWSGGRAQALALIGVIALYVQVLLRPVPHVGSVTDVAGPLVESIAAADGALVLVENHYHRDMIVDLADTSPPTPFAGNFEALLPAATGKRLYAGVWDGWQWSPYRGQLLANGAWDGRAIERVPREEFLVELRQWGVRHLFVWSDRSAKALASEPALVEQPAVGAWRHFEYSVADSAQVVTARGRGTLVARDLLGATVRLEGVSRGDVAVIRTNYHPAWTARASGSPVEIVDVNGQLGIVAPTDGAADIELVYPRRPQLLALAIVALVIGASLTEPPRRRDPA